MNYDKKFVTPSFMDALKSVLNDEAPNELSESAPVSRVKPKSKGALAKDDYHQLRKEETEELTEEQIYNFLEEEMGPHVEFLLAEGFSEDEIENIIMEMLEGTDDEDIN